MAAEQSETAPSFSVGRPDREVLQTTAPTMAPPQPEAVALPQPAVPPAVLPVVPFAEPRVQRAVDGSQPTMLPAAPATAAPAAVAVTERATSQAALPRADLSPLPFPSAAGGLSPPARFAPERRSASRPRTEDAAHGSLARSPSPGYAGRGVPPFRAGAPSPIDPLAAPASVFRRLAVRESSAGCSRSSVL